MNIIEATKEEWRDLGFFYDRIEDKRKWVFRGDRSGLLKLSAIFKEYGKNERRCRESEHDHYGPYMYLKVMTVYGRRGINDDAIYGNLKDIYHLGEMVEGKVQNMKQGEEVSLRDEYSKESDFDMILVLEPEGFDPVSADGWVRDKEAEQRANK
jgi:hypothetical protein